MTRPNDPHSVEHEPHFQRRLFETDPSEDTVDRLDLSDQTVDQSVNHTVWDEPGLANRYTQNQPESLFTYYNWMNARAQQTSLAFSWGIVALILLFTGPLSIIGTLLEQALNSFSVGPRAFAGILTVTVIGPVVEEAMKIFLAAWIIETRPYLFKSTSQIIICALAGGLGFAAIENVMYLYVYIPNAPDSLWLWRWTICVALHTICTLIAGIGLVQIWKNAWKQKRKPQLADAAPWIIAAAIVHGLYNATVTILELTSKTF